MNIASFGVCGNIRLRVITLRIKSCNVGDATPLSLIAKKQLTCGAIQKVMFISVEHLLS